MATAIEKTDKQILKCTLCNEELKKPKLLPCQHSFCTQCLVKHHDDLSEGKPFCCPTCHMNIELKDDIIESLPDNYLYEIVKEAAGTASEKNLKCVPCSQGNKRRKATHKCLDCGDTLCPHCNELHCRFTALRHHVTVSINDLRDGNSKEEFAKRKVFYCDLHSTDDHKIPLSTYCDRCRCLGCLDCVQGDHKGHAFTKVQTVRETHQSLHEENLANLERSLKDQNKIIEKFEIAITETKQLWNQQETEIYDTATELYALVEKIKEEKLMELKSHYEKEILNLTIILERERNKLSTLQATVDFTKVFLEKSSNSDFLYHEDDMESRVELSQRGKSRGLTRTRLSIDKSEVESVTEAIQDAFGRIITQEDSVHYKYKIGKVMQSFKKKIGMDDIYGLAFDTNSMEELFVVGGLKDGNILVLNKSGNYREIINWHSASDIVDIHLANAQLFVASDDEDQRGVVIVERNGEITKFIELPEDDQKSGSGLGLVVHGDNTIFVSSSEMNRIYRLRQDEESFSIFTSNEEEEDDDESFSIFSFNEKEKYLESPSYICLTPDNDLLVTNCDSSNIQLYSQEGELLWQYDGEEEGNGLDCPDGVCCDEDGYIYVADTGNRRIQVIRDRKWVGNIPIDEEAKESGCVLLKITPERELIYAYDNTIVKIAFWELE